MQQQSQLCQFSCIGCKPGSATVCKAKTEAKLPGPKMACEVDWRKSDYELVKGLLPDNLQIESFGDLAQEVP